MRRARSEAVAGTDRNLPAKRRKMRKATFAVKTFGKGTGSAHAGGIELTPARLCGAATSRRRLVICSGLKHLLHHLIKVEAAGFGARRELLEGLQELGDECLSGNHHPQIIDAPAGIIH